MVPCVSRLHVPLGLVLFDMSHESKSLMCPRIENSQSQSVLLSDVSCCESENDSGLQADTLTYRGNSKILIGIGTLKSYEHMGMAELTCVSGCECASFLAYVSTLYQGSAVWTLDSTQSAVMKELRVDLSSDYCGCLHSAQPHSHQPLSDASRRRLMATGSRRPARQSGACAAGILRLNHVAAVHVPKQSVCVQRSSSHTLRCPGAGSITR